MIDTTYLMNNITVPAGTKMVIEGILPPPSSLITINCTIPAKLQLEDVLNWFKRFGVINLYTESITRKKHSLMITYKNPQDAIDAFHLTRSIDGQAVKVTLV